MVDLRFEPTTTWHDFSIRIGLDHRAVHCQRVGQQGELQRKRRHFRNWQPYLEDMCCATRYQVMLQKLLANQSNIAFKRMESCLHIAATSGGSCSRPKAKFEPSPTLRDLRLRRRACADSSTRKEISLCISRLHRVEMRQWKSTKLGEMASKPFHVETCASPAIQVFWFAVGWTAHARRVRRSFGSSLQHAIVASYPRWTGRPNELNEVPGLFEELLAALKGLKIKKVQTRTR